MALSGWCVWGARALGVVAADPGLVDATPLSYRGHRFPVEIIGHCVWLYHRFPLSLRDVQEMMMESESFWGRRAGCLVGVDPNKTSGSYAACMSGARVRLGYQR